MGLGLSNRKPRWLSATLTEDDYDLMIMTLWYNVFVSYSLMHSV